MPLAPAVRRLVAEDEVDVSRVAGTGPGGRVTKGDVLAYLEARRGRRTVETARPAAPASGRDRSLPAPRPSDARGGEQPPASAAPRDNRETRQRMSGLRQRIAQRLVEVQQTAAILTTFNEADMSRVMELRTAVQGDVPEASTASALGFMSFFVKASIEALKAFPAVNGRIDGNEIVYHNFYDIGVAVSTERGLMVPVIRDADRLSFAADREGHRRLRRQGARGDDRGRRPPGRHVHDHQRRRSSARCSRRRSSTRPRAASSACTRSRSGRSSSTTRS